MRRERVERRGEGRREDEWRGEGKERGDEGGGEGREGGEGMSEESEGRGREGSMVTRECMLSFICCRVDKILLSSFFSKCPPSSYFSPSPLLSPSSPTPLPLLSHSSPTPLSLSLSPLDLPPEDPATLESGTTGTWAGRLPASLLPSLPSHPSPHTSPSKAPVTRPPVESPSKVRKGEGEKVCG